MEYYDNTDLLESLDLNDNEVICSSCKNKVDINDTQEGLCTVCQR